MGSFNVTCHLSGEVIKYKEQVVVMMMTPHRRGSSLAGNPWSNWSPIPILLEGQYNTYGGTENTQIFDSQDLASKEKKVALNELYDFCKEKMQIDKNQNLSNNMDDYIGSASFLSKNVLANTILAYIKVMNNGFEDFKESIEEKFKHLGFQSIEEAQEYAQKNKDNVEKKTVGFVFMKKSKLMMLLENYGAEKKHDPDIYSQTIQRQRKGLMANTETVGFVSGGDFACANKPVYTWKTIEKKSKNNSSILNNLHEQQCLDFALVNDYVHMLGKSWTPSMTINEDAQFYGQDKALKMQEMLVKTEKSPNKKFTPK